MKYNHTTPIPFPCGLSVTGVTSDGTYLYSLVPDRKTIYKMDICGRIICTYTIDKKYTRIHYSPSAKKFFAIIKDGSKLYVLNKCFNLIDSIDTHLAEPIISIGGYGTCSDNDSLVIGTVSEAYAVDTNGNILGKIGNSSSNLDYTSVFENNGYLFEGQISKKTNQAFVRSSPASQNGRTRLQRLPAGFVVNNFFCYRGKLYAYVTKNSFHGYIVAVLVDPCRPVIPSNVICLEDNAEEDCGCECLDNTCGNSCSCSCTNGYTCPTNDDDVLSDSSTNENECDTEELCKIINCIKKLCKNQQNCSCNNDCVCNNNCSNSCQNQNNCTCNTWPECDCIESDTDDEETCLLPSCDEFCNEDLSASVSTSEPSPEPCYSCTEQTDSEADRDINLTKIDNLLTNSISKAKKTNDRALTLQLMKIRELFEKFNK